MYLLLPHSLPFVNHAADALAALLLLGSQLPQADRGFGPLTLLGLCFWDLSMQAPQCGDTQLHMTSAGLSRRRLLLKGKD